MNEIINVADIVEENGKTIRQNNLEKRHNIPLGTLVEVVYDNWYGDGCCSVVKARLWVAVCERDCDGTPLYWLSRYKPGSGFWQIDNPLLRNAVCDLVGGFAENSLKVIELTDDVMRGKGALSADELK